MKFISEQNKLIIKNIVGAFLIKGGSLVISFFLLPLYLNFFENREVLGIWYTIVAVLNWSTIFDLGLGQGLRNELPPKFVENDNKGAKEYISTTYFLMILIVVIVTSIGLIIIYNIDLYYIFNVNGDILDYYILRKSITIVFLGIMLQMVLKIIVPILYALQKSALVNLQAFMSNVFILVALYIVPATDLETNLIKISWINVIASNVPYLLCTIYIFVKKLNGMFPSLHALNRKYIKDIFRTGMALFWLQLVFMVVSSLNEFLISNFSAPDYVVEYQAYNKIFKTAAMTIALALTPIWSAVTKAKIEKKYSWIIKVYYVFLCITVLCFGIELSMIPLLQQGMDIWLGKGMIFVNTNYAFAFVMSSIIFILHSINTSIGNGLSFFKLQMIWMSMAAFVFIPLAYLLVNNLNSWIGVIWASVIAMLPYEILAPIYTIRHLKKLNKCQTAN